VPDIDDTIVRLIAIEMKTSEDRVRHAGSLRKDLGMDSISAANILFAIEEEYGIELQLDRVAAVDSLVDLRSVLQLSLADAR
jgi:acyl carrier protein